MNVSLRNQKSLPILLTIMVFSAGRETKGQGQFPIRIGASPNPVGSGARAMGQGNAFIAVADDATAASWNPGGLPQLQKAEFSFAFEAISRRERITSDRHPESETTRTLNLQDLNYASLVIPFFLKRNMVFSMNYLQLLSFDKVLRFPVVNVLARETVLENRVEFDQDGEFSVLAPAFAVQVTDRLALGATFNIWNHALTDSSSYDEKKVQVGTITRNDLRGDFTSSELNRFEVDEGYSFVLGGLYRINKYWAIAGVVKPGFKMNIDHERIVADVQTGDFGVVRPENNPPPILKDSELEQPLILGIGFAWRPSDRLTVSMDGTWTQWSEYVFTEDGVERNPITGQPADVDELEDTYTLRLGSEYLVIFDEIILPIRCGIGYDPAPAVDEIDDFYTVNFGIGVQLWNRVNLDVGYEFRWGNDVNASFLRGISGKQNVRQHRMLASMIYYF